MLMGALRIFLVILLIGSGFTVSAAGLPAFEELLRSRVESITRNAPIEIAGEELAARELVAKLYETNGFQPLWTAPKRAQAMLEAIRSASDEGLNPADYHYNSLSRMLASPSDTTIEEVQRDLLLSDAFFRLAYHFRFGRLDPEKLFMGWDFSRKLGPNGAHYMLIRSLMDNTLKSTLNKLLPDTPYYRGLREALAEYRALKEAGGWQALPNGPLLKPGMRHTQIPLLRERLQREDGYIAPGEGPVDNYDSILEKAVKAFQQRHGLEPDGIVGPSTRRELNLGVDQRIAQIRVNMERLRWVFNTLPPEFLLVDIAGFRVMLVRNKQPVWETRAIVGRPYRQTALFRADMSYLVINPTWTVPPTIMREDIWPRLSKDRSILAEKNLRIIDLEGREVDPDSLDWSKLSPRHFPYQLRQSPGPTNALGRIKFMFPNSHFIYLHDTPSRSLFDKSQRAFSSGCIRIQKPLELAEIVLSPGGGWTRERLNQAIDAGNTRTVRLKQKIPVIIMYFTAVAEEGKRVAFRPDLYKRDRKVFKALEQRL